MCRQRTIEKTGQQAPKTRLNDNGSPFLSGLCQSKFRLDHSDHLDQSKFNHSD